MKRLGILILGLFIWSGCGDDDEQLSDGYKQIRVVTGLDITDINGNPVGTWQKPNHNPGPLRLFPVPSGNELFVSSQTVISDLWVVPASCEKDSTNRNIALLSLDLEYDLDEVEMNQINSISIENFNNQILLNLSGSSVGFYKIFARTSNGDLFWHNIYYDPSLVPLLNFNLLNEVCE